MEITEIILFSKQIYLFTIGSNTVSEIEQYFSKAEIYHTNVFIDKKLWGLMGKEKCKLKHFSNSPHSPSDIFLNRMFKFNILKWLCIWKMYTFFFYYHIFGARQVL